MKTMTVEDGYVLTASDYPTTYGVTWQQYTSPITSDVTVNGTYSWGGYGAADEAEATGEIAAESTAVSRTGSTTLVKTVTETYDYVYNGGRLSQVKKTTSTTTSSGTTNATDTLNFTYDANGTPMAVKYNGTMYYFVTNVQSDVTAILNTSGTAVAQYTYDAWGNILTTTGSMASTLGTLNPLRYRGYVYDQETGFYYVSSRYYDPEIGRFISPDDVDLLGANGDFASLNLFAYCGNNPVLREDKSGGFWHVVAGAVIGGIFEIGSQLVSNGGSFSEINWTKVGIATAVGGVTAMCGPVSGAVISGLGNVSMELAGGTTDLAKLGISFAVGFGASLVGYGLGKVAQKMGGKMAVNSLSKKSPGQIKRVVNKVIDVAGRDRNRVKNLSWTLSQKAYSHLPDVLIGKTVPQIFNSIGVGISGYGTMGALYGFN